MRYHMDSEYDDVMKIREDREKNWDDFMHRAECNQYLTKEEAVRMLYELQEYLSCDFPFEQRNCDKGIINAFELICRAAISLVENPNPIQDSYVTSKLYAALNYLAINK